MNPVFTPFRLAAIGVIAWALAALLWIFWIPAERRQLDALREARATVRLPMPRTGPRGERSDRPPGERFIAAFPEQASRPQRVELLLAAATSRKLAWQRADFHPARDGVPGLARYQVTLPLSGSYGALRGMVDDALRDDPATGLDRLQLRRAAATAQLVEVTSVWSLYTREGTSGRAPSAPAALP